MFFDVRISKLNKINVNKFCQKIKIFRDEKNVIKSAENLCLAIKELGFHTLVEQKILAKPGVIGQNLLMREIFERPKKNLGNYSHIISKDRSLSY